MELYRITGERSYIGDAILAADYTLEHLTVEGDILQPEGTGDGGIFKGIFVRYFTLWAAGITTDGRIGPDWRSRPGTPSAMTPQLSGCMLIEAMALLEREGLLP